MSSALLTISSGENVSCRRRQWTSASLGRSFDTVTVNYGLISLQADVADIVRLRDELTRVIGDATPAPECVRQPVCTAADRPDGGGQR